jgi:hypothetical protein
MAFVFVQLWGPLPTINQVLMGDSPSDSRPAGDLSNAPQGTRSAVSQSSSRVLYSENENRTGSQASPAQSPQTGYPPMQTYVSQQHAQHARPDGFNMASIGNALPDLAYQSYGNVPPQRYPQGPASPGLVYQVQNIPQYTGAPNVSPSTATYGMQYQGQYPAMYAGNTAQHLQAPGAQFYHSQGFVGQPQQQGSPYLVQPNQYGPQGQMYTGSPSPYGMRSSFSGDSRLLGQQRSNEYLGASASGPTGRSSSIGT